MYVTSYVPIPGTRNAFRGTYGNGMSLYGVDKAAPTRLTSDTTVVRPSSKFPASASVLKPEELEVLAKRFQHAIDHAQANPLPVAPLAPDWTTQGSWLGRIGRYVMVHSGANSPYDLCWGTGAANVDYNVQQGKPGTESDDMLRYFVHPPYTSDPRSLELTMPYLHSRIEKGLTTWDVNRRQSEWDDHGEVTTPNREGPGIFFTMTVPPGNYCLSFYGVFGYGRFGNEPNRDYLLSVREHPADAEFKDVSHFFEWPELAKVRVVKHFGGVYTRFVVQGPRTFTVYEDRNWSFNANLNGAFLDEMTAFPACYYGPGDREGGEADAHLALLKMLEGLPNKSLDAYALDSRRTYVDVARWLVGTDFPGRKLALAKTCYFLGMHEKSEEIQRSLGMVAARDIEKSLRWKGNANTFADENLRLVTQWRSERAGT